MLLMVILKALLIGILLGALLYWFSARKQCQSTVEEGQGDASSDTVKSSRSIFLNFVKNLLLLIVIMTLPLVMIRFIL